MGGLGVSLSRGFSIPKFSNVKVDHLRVAQLKSEMKLKKIDDSKLFASSASNDGLILK